MARQKKTRFEDSATKRNIVQAGKENFGKLRGRWACDFFGNDKPLVAELGCGKGEYTVGLAREHPEANHVGVDIKGPRIWVGADEAQRDGLDNAAFLRNEIQNIDMHFGPGELLDIWIPFPDPQPKGRDERRRLTSPRFLELYQSLLAPGGQVRLKTDSRFLFDYTLEVLKRMPIEGLEYTFDLYNSPLLAEHFGIQTTFEKKFLGLGMPIQYLRFRFRG